MRFKNEDFKIRKVYKTLSILVVDPLLVQHYFEKRCICLYNNDGRGILIGAAL